MKRLKVNILEIRIIVVAIAMLFSFTLVARSEMAIQVYAGEDGSLCEGDLLDLNALNATITGDVSDGIWFTTGDGVFGVSNSSNVVFSIATTYSPGPNDITSGGFSLILVSDDPDGNGPQTEVSDQVDFTFQAAPALACNQNLSVSLGPFCEQELDIFMLLANPQEPYDRYNISAYDEGGNLIADNVLRYEHIGQEIDFTVNHDCGNNSCWGMLTVSDNTAPPIVCNDVTIDCRSSLEAIYTGLPIPTYQAIDTIAPDSFQITGWDDCSDVLLWHIDNTVNLSCAEPYDRIIARTWFVRDQSNNQSICTQSIYVERIGLDSIQIPSNYNDLDLPALSCDADYPLLESGYPSPEYTGGPNLYACSNIEARFDDIVYETCGGGYSLVRSWFVIDWCTTEDLEFNQIIKLKDTLAPIFNCPDNITIGTDAYDCVSLPFMLMELDSIEDCSAITVHASLRNTISNEIFSSSDLNFDRIPKGSYEAQYIVSDECGNTSSCTSSIIIEDTSKPFPICDGFTSISITDNGEARLFATSLDDGSLDNCGIDYFSIAKMSDECNANNLEFGEYVTFCCEEVGQSVMVAFQVTDLAGNVNTCMAEVMVEDKLRPQIYCPSDLTISCDYPLDLNDLSDFGTVRAIGENREDIFIWDTYNNGVAGLDGYYEDNCIASVSDTAILNIDCGHVGSIHRIFTVTDGQGLADTCVQEISIINLDPFEGTDIIWPQNVLQQGCGNLGLDPSVTGQPSYNNAICAMVEATYVDQVLIISDTSCVKVLRTWTVIDWCQFDQFTRYGLWEYIQEIKLENTEAPIINSCQDIELCSYADNCGPAQWSFVIDATDDCTNVLDMMYEWSIDLYQDGSQDLFGSTRLIDIELPLGQHTFSQIVEDRCGNLSTCSFEIEVTDCKRPTPYCNSSLTTVIMPTSGTVDLLASQFDLGGFDNCGPLQAISFSQNINDISKTLTCDSLNGEMNAIIDLQIWYTDQAGNQDYCNVQVILQDPNNACNTANTYTISGRIASINDEIVDSIEVYYQEDGGESGSVFAINGEYIIEDLTPGNYTLTPVKDAKADEGISTLDLVLIQRHIIRLAPFDSPYKILAGDVNNTTSLSGADIVMMRKLVLGKINEITGDPYRFVPSNYVFSDPENPWDALGTLRIEGLSEDMEDQDFVVIKRGDVDQSSFSLNQNNNIENRSSSIGFEYKEDHQGGIKFIASRDMNLDGFQLSLEGNDYELADVGESSLLTNEMVHSSNDQFLISFSSNEALSITKGQVLFSLNRTNHFEAPLALGTSLKAEVYENLVAYPLQLRKIASDDTLINVQVANNPFFDQPNITLLSPWQQEVDYVLYNALGEVIYTGSQFIEAGASSLDLPSHLFLSRGLYFLNVQDAQDHLCQVSLIKL